MGRPSNREQRRKDIVEAALVVIAKSGYDGASVQAIAKQAQLSAGLLHHHFGSKAAVLEELLQTLQARVEARHAKLARAKQGAWGRLEAWVDAHLATGEDADAHAVGAWVWIGAEALKGGSVRDSYGAVMKQRHATLGALIGQAALERGVDVDVDQCVTTVLAAVEGYYALASSTDVVRAGSAAQAVRRLLDRLL